MSDLLAIDRFLYGLGILYMVEYVDENYGFIKRSEFLDMAGHSDHNRGVWMVMFGVDEVKYSPGDLFGGVDPANDQLFQRVFDCANDKELFFSMRDAFIEGIENELPF
tara:strand:- start:62 stop:385 length:324 start_codon:yes stop_codon:yes gene_type:complete